MTVLSFLNEHFVPPLNLLQRVLLLAASCVSEIAIGAASRPIFTFSVWPQTDPKSEAGLRLCCSRPPEGSPDAEIIRVVHLCPSFPPPHVVSQIHAPAASRDVFLLIL